MLLLAQTNKHAQTVDELIYVGVAAKESLDRAKAGGFVLYQQKSGCKMTKLQKETN